MLQGLRNIYSQCRKKREKSDPITHDMLRLREMFGDDAQTNSSNSKNGLCLNEAQIDTINLSWCSIELMPTGLYLDVAGGLNYQGHQFHYRTNIMPYLDAWNKRML